MGTGQLRGPKAAITIVVMLAAVMAMIDISIVNVALTDIRASFATPLDQIGWVSTGYMMANIVVIPMTGWLRRRRGARGRGRGRAGRRGGGPAGARRGPRAPGRGRRRGRPGRAGGPGRP